MRLHAVASEGESGIPLLRQLFEERILRVIWLKWARMLSPVHTEITSLKTHVTSSVINKSYTICGKMLKIKKKF
jgi:hypothetical protein